MQTLRVQFWKNAPHDSVSRLCVLPTTTITSSSRSLETRCFCVSGVRAFHAVVLLLLLLRWVGGACGLADWAVVQQTGDGGRRRRRSR